MKSAGGFGKDFSLSSEGEKREKKHGQRAGGSKTDPDEGIRRFGGIAIFLAFSLFTILLTFYFRDGYTMISTRKQEIFYGFSRIAFPCLLAVFLLSVFLSGREQRRRLLRCTLTDVFALILLGTNLLSFCLSPYQAIAWEGTPQWNMGLKTLLLCFLIYFFVSRLYDERYMIYPVLLLTSGIAFLWGLLDRLGIHPVAMAYAEDNFIGPMGNINWFAGYFSVFLPMGLFLFFTEKRKPLRILAAFHAVISVLFGILEGSDSTFLALAVTGVMLYLFLSQKLREKHPFLGLLPVMVLGLLVLTVILMITVNTLRPGSLGPLSERSFFTFDSRWGTFRGTTWRAGLIAFLALPAGRKLVGVGQDGFESFVYSVPELVNYLSSYFGGRLRNAHCEFLNLLITTGIFGTASFYLFTISGAWRLWRRKAERLCAPMLSACILSYLVHNIVSFQTILNLPFLFLVLGLMGYELRK